LKIAGKNPFASCSDGDSPREALQLGLGDNNIISVKHVPFLLSKLALIP
jgi:hypothetical protein